MSITPEDPNQPGAPAGPPTPPPAWGQPAPEGQTPPPAWGQPAPEGQTPPPAWGQPAPEGQPGYPPAFGGPGMPPPPPAPKRPLWKRPRLIAGVVLLLVIIGGAIAAQRPDVKDSDYADNAHPDKSADVVFKVPDANVGDCWKGTLKSGYEKTECTQQHDVQVYWVGKARTFDSYRKAGEKLVAGQAQADAACGKAAPDVAWTFTQADAQNASDSYLFPSEDALNAASATDKQLQIVCLIDSASVKAATRSVIEGH